MSTKAEIFVQDFFAHPNPIVYTYRPETPEMCKMVIPEVDGSFSKKSSHLGLGSFLLEAGNLRDLRSLWHSWDETGLWNYTQRQKLVDALGKPLTFFFDCPTISPELFPEDLKDPKFHKLDVRRVPFFPWLKGPIFEVVLGLQDVVPVFSLEVPMKPTRMHLEELGLVYAGR